jgi:(p)ppGpp synthase/HD superfamily hydrolase
MMELEIFLRDLGCFDVRHSGQSLGDHLMNTASLLEFVDAPEHVILAGGLHSIYGTNAFRTGVLGPEDREKIRAAFGDKVEHLVYLFSKINRPNELESVSASGGVVFGKALDGNRPQFDLSQEEVRDLRLMEVANLLEQEASLNKYPKMAEVFEAQVALGADQPTKSVGESCVT